MARKANLSIFYSRKLTDSKKIYTVTEKDMLGIIDSLKEFRTILLGKIIIIYTHEQACYGQKRHFTPFVL